MMKPAKGSVDCKGFGAAYSGNKSKDTSTNKPRKGTTAPSGSYKG